MFSQLDVYELLHCDLVELDRTYAVLPTNAVDFIVRMTEIPLPANQLPVFGARYTDRLGQLSNEETLTFCQDFDAIIKRVGTLNDDVKNIVLDFFNIKFMDDASNLDIDLLCYQAFGNLDASPTPPPAKKSRAQPLKRGKRYNTPVIRSSCTNCEEQILRLSLIKKISNAKVTDLMKFDGFVKATKVENAFLATLPPMNEIDPELHEQLLRVMENKLQVQNKYLEEDLPSAVDAIKLH